MKWIGQHIVSLISRFRSDVYLEDIDTGTIASGSNLGLDSNNKIVKATASSGGGTPTDITVANEGTDTTCFPLFVTSPTGDLEPKTNANWSFNAQTDTLSCVGFTGNFIGDLTGTADEADILSTARTIAGVSFDGSANISLNNNAITNGAGYTTNTGDITGVDLTGAGPISINSETGTTSGDYSATIGIASASTTVIGAVELATTAETTTGTDTTRAVTPDGLKDGYRGSANITTVGIVSSGQWRGTAINRTYIEADQRGITAVGTITAGTWQATPIATAYIADDAVTFAKAQGVTPNVFDNKIKLIPSDFMANDDGGNQKFGVGYVETAGTGYGMRTANNATELYAFVSIPQGMTATHVDIFDKNDLAVEVFEAQINATTMVSKGSGNANTTIDIDDVASTATNFLVIEVTTTSATNDKVYGGTVTIA